MTFPTDATRTLLVAALEATPVNVTIADATRPDRPLVFVNAAFTRTTGYAAAEALGRNCRFLQGPGTDPDAVERLRCALSRGEPIEVELLNYKRDGAPFWNALVITPVRDARGRLEAFVGLQVDVTAKRAAAEREHQARRMEALGALAGSVAHEINNLLQPMLSLPALIKPTLPREAEEERGFLDLIEDHARGARAVVREILAYSRAADGPPLATVEARAAIDRALVSVRAICPPGVRLVRTGALAGRGDLGLVELCPSLLAQALVNLARNAIDAMGGAGALAIGANVEGDRLLIDVADTGCGMTEATRARIFEPFFTTKPIGQGTGLGLPLARADVARWGGDILVESAPGRGSVFTIVLPIRRAAEAAA